MICRHVWMSGVDPLLVITPFVWVLCGSSGCKLPQTALCKSEIFLSSSPFKAEWLLYVPPDFILKYCTFLAGVSVLCLIWTSEQTTGQLYQGFPWFSCVPQQMLTRYQNSTLHCMLPTRPSPKSTKTFVEKPPPQSTQIFVILLLSKHKTEPKHSSSSLCCILRTDCSHHTTFLHFPALNRVFRLSLWEGRAGTACEPSEQ